MSAVVLELIHQARTNKFVAGFGARKMWLHLRGKGHDVARCTIERLMHAEGLAGVLRGKDVRTTIADGKADRPADLVDRNFSATRPNQLWAADFERHEGFLDLAVVKGHRWMPVAAGI